MARRLRISGRAAGGLVGVGALEVVLTEAGADAELAVGLL